MPAIRVREFASFRIFLSPLAKYVITVKFNPIVPTPAKMEAIEM